jgi:hypothetical protein
MNSVTPYLFHDSPWQIQRRVPLRGEHQVEVLDEIGYGSV